MSKANHHDPERPGDCRRQRLAETSVASVDACECGTMQLNLGAFTVRLAPCAMGTLLRTLEAAMDVYNAECPLDPNAQNFPAFGSKPRGKA